MSLQKKEIVSAIQALRAFAVTSVVINHTMPRALSGGYIGVDIFFVISGFLITSHLVNQLDRGSFTFGSFYLRRARRLLPAALTTLAVTALFSLAVLPPAWQATTFSGIAAAGIYIVNWWLAASSVDYFTDSGVVSPVLHFWSLSVEEQFYLLWPAGIWLTWYFADLANARNRLINRAHLIGIVLGLVVVVSLILAIQAEKQHPSAAYFFTHARAWEFGVGGLASISTVLDTLRRYRRLRQALFIVCWASLAFCVFFFTPDTGVPGLAAVPIVIATAVLLRIGDHHGIPSARSLANFAPVRWLGDASYSIYLWHWPFLVLAPFVLRDAHLNPPQKMILAGLMLSVAALSKKYIEDSFRIFVANGKNGKPLTQPWRQCGAFLALSALLSVGCFGVANFRIQRSAYVAQRLYDLSLKGSQCFGGRASDLAAHCPFSHKLLEPDFALQNWNSQIISLPNEKGRDCQNQMGVAGVSPCSFGASLARTKRSIALLGDSHAGMWASALGQFVEEKGIRVYMLLASSCPVTENRNAFAYYLPPNYRPACLTWRDAAIKWILSHPTIDTVVVSGNVYNLRQWTSKGWIEDDGSGFVSVWRRFVAAGKRVVVIDDVPLLPWKLPDCLARPHPEFDPCTHSARDVPVSTPLSRAVALMPAGAVSFISFKDVFCDRAACHSVIGGIPAYMDSDHISAPMSRSLAYRLQPIIAPDTSSFAAQAPSNKTIH